MFSKIIVVCLFAMLAVSSAHLCLMDPVQRGGTKGSDVPNAEICHYGDTFSPCNTVAAPEYSLKVAQNSSFTVTYNKNKNHWMPQYNPMFTINLLTQTSSGLQSVTLATIADEDSPDLTETSVDVYIDESVPPGNHTIQVIYDTDRPTPDYPSTNYYACADILVA